MRKRSGWPFAAWYLRAILMAASFASAPELAKKTTSAKVAADEALGEPLALRNPEEVRGVPDLAGLLGEGRDEVRVGVAERVDGDAGAEIEVSLPVAPEKPGTLPLFERQIGARVGRQQRGGHGPSPIGTPGAARGPKTKAPPGWGGTGRDSNGAEPPVNSREMKSGITAFRGPERVPWGKPPRRAGTLAPESTRSSRFSAVEYDISCGGITLQDAAQSRGRTVLCPRGVTDSGGRCLPEEAMS